MKQYRDSHGSLFSSLEAIANLTQEKAETYYMHGQMYLNESDQRTYICQRTSEQFTSFIRMDGRQIIVPTEKLGTFLPDVASEGMAIRKI